MIIETNLRSLVKTISWRFWATVTTAILVYAFTGELDLPITIGGIEVFSKLVLYYLHERVWNLIRFGRRKVKPCVIWFTGLSGSGKSTLAKAVYERLQGQEVQVERLDGDSIRDIFPNTGFTRPERDQHIRRVGFLASRLEKAGVFVVSSFISPFEESRQFVRKQCKNFVEVHVSTPLTVCEKRDVKGLYAKARRGEIKNFTGIDDPYEEPSRPEIKVDTSEVELERAVQEVMSVVERLK